MMGAIQQLEVEVTMVKTSLERNLEDENQAPLLVATNELLTATNELLKEIKDDLGGVIMSGDSINFSVDFSEIEIDAVPSELSGELQGQIESLLVTDHPGHRAHENVGKGAQVAEVLRARKRLGLAVTHGPAGAERWTCRLSRWVGNLLHW